MHLHKKVKNRLANSVSKAVFPFLPPLSKFMFYNALLPPRAIFLPPVQV